MSLAINVVLPRFHVLMYFVIEGCKETYSVYMTYSRIQDVSVTEIPKLCEQRFAVILMKVFQIAAVGTNLVANLCASVVVYTATGRCLHHM
jgi:hypothetical protein